LPAQSDRAFPFQKNSRGSGTANALEVSYQMDRSRLLDERTMPLLGYLVTLSILLGGGYVGLQWLAAPGHHPAASERSARHNANVPVKAASNEPGRVPVPSEADRKQSASTEPASTARTDVSTSQPSGEHSKVENAESLPAEGCEPVGVTAKGDVVFPMRCEALIQHQPGQLSSPPPVQTAPSDQQDQALGSANSNLSSNAAEAGPSDNAGASGPSGNSNPIGWIWPSRPSSKTPATSSLKSSKITRRAR
jgi:hypothetical protein